MPVLTLNGKPLISNNQVLTGSSGGDSYTNGDNLAYGTAGLAGTTWYFNETLDFTGQTRHTYQLNFISNNSSHSQLYIDSQMGGWTLAFSEIVYAYVPPIMTIGWDNQAYRTITITGGDDANNPDLIAWIQANAVQQ